MLAKTYNTYTTWPRPLLVVLPKSSVPSSIIALKPS